LIPVDAAIAKMWKTHNGKVVDLDLFRQFVVDAIKVPGRYQHRRRSARQVRWLTTATATRRWQTGIAQKIRRRLCRAAAV
jgi:hypothetical protein